MLRAFLAGTGAVASGWLASSARRARTADRVGAFARGGVGRRLPGRQRRRLAEALGAAAIDLAPEQACELWLACVVAAGLLTLTLSPGLAVVVTIVTLAAGPAGLWLARGRRRRRFVAALPGGLEQVATELRGGGTVSTAVAALAGGSGPLAADFARIRDRAALGVGLGAGLAAWPGEAADVTEVRAVAGAMAMAATVGGRSAAALDGLAASLRDRLGAAAEARALSAQARLSAAVVGAAPIAFLVFSAAVDPGSVDVLVGTASGRACLAVGLVLEVLAVWWMRRIVGREP